MINRLVEQDKAYTSAVARDVLMRAQTNILMSLGGGNISPEQQLQAKQQFQQTARAFATELERVVMAFADGRVTREQVLRQWNILATKYYTELFRLGAGSVGNVFYKGGIMPESDQQFIARAIKRETGFFTNFINAIAQQTTRVPMERRVMFYAQSAEAMFWNGVVAGAGDQVEIHWVMDDSVQDHCADCPVLASKTYTWDTLPTTPRAGDTECLFNCRCHLEVRLRGATSTSTITPPGSAVPSATTVAGRWAMGQDLTSGNEFFSPILDDMFARMYKARQMVTLSDSPELRRQWINIRKQLNDDIIKLWPKEQYRVVPAVSVKELLTAVRSAVAELGGTAYVAKEPGLVIGREIVLLRGNVWVKGIMQSDHSIIDAKGNIWTYRDNSDILLTAERTAATGEVPFELGVVHRQELLSSVWNRIRSALALDEVPELPSQVRESLVHYQLAGYININQALHGRIPMDEITEAHIRLLDRVFATELSRPVVVWRGTRAREGWQQKLIPGTVFQDAAYGSASFSQQLAMEFTRPEAPMLFEIVVPRGTKVCLPHLYTRRQDREFELLLPRGTKFKVISVRTETHNGREMPVVRVEVMNG